jgi:predicted DNA-binding ribbon-helix-helix protein
MPQPSKARLQKSLVASRKIKIGDRNFGISVEAPFWAALREIAAAQGTSVPRLVASIDNERQHANRSSEVRLFVLGYYRSRCRPERPSDAQGS